MDLIFGESESGRELVNVTPICLYRGETANIFFDVKQTFSDAIVKLNGLVVARVKTPVVGINATRLVKGANRLEITLLDDQNAIIQELQGVLVKRDSIRGMDNIEQELTELLGALDKLSLNVEELMAWREEIDNERSGY